MENESNVISLEEVRNEKSNNAKFVEKTGLFNTKSFCSNCADKIDLNDFADGSHSWTVINDTVEMVRTVEGKEGKSTFPLQKVVEYYLRHYLHSSWMQVKEQEELEQEELRKKNKELFDVKRKKLVESYLDYVIDAVKEELPKRGIKFNRSNKCLSNIRKILKEIEVHFYRWDWENCITKGWFIENEEKINQLVPLRNPEENTDNINNKNKRSNREWFGCNELAEVCHRLINHDIYVPYDVWKQNTKDLKPLDYLILNS